MEYSGGDSLASADVLPVRAKKPRLDFTLTSISMNISIIGAGNMGSAITRGLAQKAEAAGYSLTVSNPTAAKLTALQADCPHLKVTADNRIAAQNADLVILTVKPWKIQEVLVEIQPELDWHRQSIASLAAGISLEQLGTWLTLSYTNTLPPLYRVIPNTAAAVQQSMTFISSAHSTPEQDTRVLTVFRALGEAVLVEENKLAACTALASCGIAYVLRFIRAAMAGGVELGLSTGEARDYMPQTLHGHSDPLRTSGHHPEEEIDRVTTPGGLTIRGLNTMEAYGFSHSVIQGLKASVR